MDDLEKSDDEQFEVTLDDFNYEPDITECPHCGAPSEDWVEIYLGTWHCPRCGNDFPVEFNDQEEDDEDYDEFSKYEGFTDEDWDNLSDEEIEGLESSLEEGFFDKRRKNVDVEDIDIEGTNEELLKKNEELLAAANIQEAGRKKIKNPEDETEKGTGDVSKFTAPGRVDYTLEMTIYSRGDEYRKKIKFAAVSDLEALKKTAFFTVGLGTSSSKKEEYREFIDEELPELLGEMGVELSEKSLKKLIERNAEEYTCILKAGTRIILSVYEDEPEEEEWDEFDESVISNEDETETGGMYLIFRNH